MSTAWRSALAVAAAFGAVACGAVLGLNDYGDAPVDAGVGTGNGEGGGDGPPVTTDGGNADDAELDSAQGTPEAESDGGAGDTGAAADAEADSLGTPGWTPVAFVETPDAGCPAGFTRAPETVVIDPSTATPASNACSCDGCSVTTPPSCVTGAISGHYDINQSVTCTTTAPTLANADAGGCNTDNPHTGIANLDILWNPLPASGGACSASPTAHEDRVTFAKRGLVCPADTDGGSPLVPSPFLECVMSPGNVPCPPGPLNVQHLAGTGAVLSCSGTCSCAVTGTCQNGVVTYYKNGTCGGASLVMPADGQCRSVLTGSTFSNTYGSYAYTATLSTMGCSANGSLSATITGLTAEQTICCAQ